MNPEPSDKGQPSQVWVGLCELCVNRRITRNRVGSNFHLCSLSKTDPCYPKYPVLPVLTCEGFDAGSELPSAS